MDVRELDLGAPNQLNLKLMRKLQERVALFLRPDPVVRLDLDRIAGLDSLLSAVTRDPLYNRLHHGEHHLRG